MASDTHLGSLPSIPYLTIECPDDKDTFLQTMFDYCTKYKSNIIGLSFRYTKDGTYGGKYTSLGLDIPAIGVGETGQFRGFYFSNNTSFDKNWYGTLLCFYMGDHDGAYYIGCFRTATDDPTFQGAKSRVDWSTK